jgi:Fe-S cluster biogenesis protein NfuA
MKIKNKKNEQLKKEVEGVLDKLREGIKMHGGGVKVESVQKGVVRLKIMGACIGCPMARLTFGEGVAAELKKIRGVKKVEYN